MKLTIVKLGGSAITRKKENLLEVNRPVLGRLAGEIAEALAKKRMRLIVVHGAGPYGHVSAKRYELGKGLKGPEQVKGMALTHQRMEELNFQVVAALLDAGVNAIAFQPSAAGVLEDGRLVSFPIESIGRLLDLGLVPVAYGDVLPDLKRGLSILSGDHLIPYLAGKLAADRVIITTSHNGIFDRDPEEKGARKYDIVDEKIVGELDFRAAKGTDVTGGIGGKVRELMALSRHGVSSEIISAMEPGYLRRALLGETGIGTRII